MTRHLHCIDVRLMMLCAITSCTLVACQSIDDRIAEHATSFYNYPPETQQRLRNKQLKIGDSPEMAYIAFGNPSSRAIHESEGNPREEIWTYAYEESFSSSHMYRNSWHDCDHHWHYHHITPTYTRTRVIRQLTFVKGRLVTLRTGDDFSRLR